MDQIQAVTALAALAQDSRLAVYRLLVKRGPEGYAAGELGERLAIPGPTLSFHLKALAHAGLVSTRKAGRYVYYAADFAGIDTLVAYLTENCCSLGSGAAAACGPSPAACEPAAGRGARAGRAPARSPAARSPAARPPATRAARARSA